MTKQEFIEKWKRWFSYNEREKLANEMESDLDSVKQTLQSMIGEKPVRSKEEIIKPFELIYSDEYREIELNGKYVHVEDALSAMEEYASQPRQNKLEALKEWLALKIIERRDYKASKAYEEVLKKIGELHTSEPLTSEKCEYEYLFDSPLISGWHPIAYERIIKPENIEKYIASGFMRRMNSKCLDRPFKMPVLIDEGGKEHEVTEIACSKTLNMYRIETKNGLNLNVENCKLIQK
jgi:hypothetical protein